MALPQRFETFRCGNYKREAESFWRMELKSIVEALLFASPEPIPAREIARCIRAHLNGSDPEDAPEDSAPVEIGSHVENPLAAELGKTTPAQVEQAILILNQEYKISERVFRILEGPLGWRMASLPEFAYWIRELFPGHKSAKLSPPALETLAIIAYRQPITKSDIEAVRGVSVDGVMNKIIDRGLVKIVGRSELPGRPLLYGTTDLFMEHFGIKKVDDLPNAAELRTVKLPNADGGDQLPREVEKQMELAEFENPPQPPQSRTENG